MWFVITFELGRNCHIATLYLWVIVMLFLLWVSSIKLDFEWPILAMHTNQAKLTWYNVYLMSAFTLLKKKKKKKISIAPHNGAFWKLVKISVRPAVIWSVMCHPPEKLNDCPGIIMESCVTIKCFSSLVSLFSKTAAVKAKTDHSKGLNVICAAIYMF